MDFSVSTKSLSITDLLISPQLDFQKPYDSLKTEELRKNIFWKNLKTIAHHNLKFRRGQSSFKMGLNYFTDMTFTEYSNLFKANETTKKSFVFEPVVITGFEDNSAEIPTSFDWREKGAVTAVKDQELCGSCYAMATLASVESQLFIKTGKLVQLSEQEIIDCAEESGLNKCQGGIGFQVYDYIKANGGISSSLDYPYEAKNGKCRRNGKNKVEIDMKSYGFVYTKAVNNDDLLMKSLINIGPIMISIDTDHESFMHYSSGVYYEEECTGEVNHGALLVGFGTEKGKDFWIVKNSFGDKFGESGYVRMTRGRENDCSLSKVPLFPILN
jgi:C1A family cysteine protease